MANKEANDGNFKDDSIDTNNTSTCLSSPTDKENYYLISALWVKNMMTFIERFENSVNTDKFVDHLDKIFNKNNVLNLYFIDQMNSEISRNGIYPSQVNNFFIMQFKDAWFDPQLSESHTNIFLKKGIIENEDFFYLNEKNWEFIKNTFGHNFEIQRKTANISGNFVIEVNLRKVICFINN
jgi:hypothetical protein